MKYLYLGIIVVILVVADRCGIKLKDVPERDHLRGNINPMTQPQ